MKETKTKKRQPKIDFGPLLRDVEKKLAALPEAEALKIEVGDVDKEFFRRQVNAVRQLLWRRDLAGKFHVRSNYWPPKRAGEITVVHREFYWIHGIPVPTQGRKRGTRDARPERDSDSEKKRFTS